MAITKTPKQICEVCGNKALLDTFQTRTIENKEMSMCSQCVEHVEGNDQKLSDLDVVSKIFLNFLNSCNIKKSKLKIAKKKHLLINQ